MRKPIFSLLLVVFVSSALACVEGSEPLGELPVYASALERDRFVAQTIRDPGPRADEQEIAKLMPVFENVEANAEALFKRADFAQRLGSIEEAYWIAGKYLDLIALYKGDVERQGMQSPAAVRLAWAWIRIGQEQEALKLSEALARERVEDADAWFLLGAYWLKRAGQERDAALRVAAFWQRAVELDALYVGFEGIDAMTMQREVARLTQTHAASQSELDALIAAYIPQRAEDDGSAEPPPPVEEPTQPIAPQPVSAPQEEPAVEPAPAVRDDTANQPQRVEPQRVEPQRVEPLSVVMARARIHLHNKEQSQAQQRLAEAIQRELPEGKIDRAHEVKELTDGQLFELVQLSWSLNLNRGASAKLFRVLASRPVASSDVLYQRAMFAWRMMEDRELALELFSRLEREHPEAAKRLDVAAVKRRITE